MCFPCNADHRCREVQSMRDRTARRGSRREMARPTRNVKVMLARREFGDFKQRLDEGRCRMREAVSIDCSSTLPASMLEGTDCFGLSAHQEAPSWRSGRNRARWKKCKSLKEHGNLLPW